jgi:hypothetical protein
LKNVSAFQSKKSSSQTISSEAEHKEQSTLSTSEKVPKPARFISDEEYSQALKFSKNFETVNSKKSLRELLDKNLNQPRPPKAIFERDIDEGLFNEENKIHSARTKPLADNFLTLDESLNRNNEELINTRPVKNLENDLFSSSFPDLDLPKPCENSIPKLPTNFLEIEENSKPEISDLLEIHPILDPFKNPEILSFDQSSNPLDSQLKDLQNLESKTFQIKSTPNSHLDIFDHPPTLNPPSNDFISLSENLPPKSDQNDFGSIFSTSASLFSAPNK